MADVQSFEALVPKEVARKAAQVGVAKAALPACTMFALAVLAGAFIALGGVFSTVVASGTGVLPSGIVRLLMGMSFSAGLILVVLAGAELFTGNNLIVMAWASRKVSTKLLLRNWGIVLIGNAVGAVATAWLVVASGHFELSSNAALLSLKAAVERKAAMPAEQAFVAGLLGNACVCLAVWLSLGARSATDKILAVMVPISLFVACGFEHCVANFYYFAAAEFSAGGLDAPFSAYLWSNLVPVTAGNIVGGAGLVGLVYWFIYLRHDHEV